MVQIMRRKLDPITSAEQIGEQVIGPVVNRWLLALHQYISYLDDGDTEFLFCARAGLRIKKLYDAYIGSPAKSESLGRVLWSSRLAACKGVFQRFQSGAEDVLTREYRHDSLENMIKGVLRNAPELLELIDFKAPRFAERGAIFPQWLSSGSTDSRIVKRYLNQCGIGFDKYLDELKGARRKVVLIDSGWQGTVQWLLTNAYPETEWKGLYFGRIVTTERDCEFFDHVIGLMFEANEYSPLNPASAVVHFHHLIEVLLESRGPSIEEIPSGAYRAVANRQIAANEKVSLTDGDDPLFRGVMTHIQKSRASDSNISSIFAKYEKALPDFERLILFPTIEEAQALGNADRSADFGKAFTVPVLRTAADFRDESQEQRIDRSLWKQGQIALEFNAATAKERQLELIGRAHETEGLEAKPNVRVDDGASVAIITRTKNRPILLSRAAESVASQTHQNYTWVVVNDGGDIDRVKLTLERCSVERHKILLLNSFESRGMEAASNLGIRHSQSKFIVIHDDDDSWSPTFLEKTVKFLTSSKGRPYGGVITPSTYVSEEISGDIVVEHRRVPYHDWVRNVHIAEMARENFFPPIAFLFHRSIYDEIGGYNEDLPVLGDWFFNMEFLLKADIGVITDTMAYYHHRDVGKADGAYSNSVIGGISKHEEFASVARNSFLRKHPQSAAAFSAVSGYFAREAKALIQNSASGKQFELDRAGIELAELEKDFDRVWLINQLNSGFVFDLTDNLQEYRRRLVSADASLDQLISTIVSRSIKIRTPPNFDEASYLAEYDDVAEACRAGSVQNGYIHFLAYGRGEGRKRFRRGC